MAKNRMAGDKLDEPTQESADAKEALSQSERRERGRQRIANDPDRSAERLSSVDRDKYDFDGYSDKDIIMAYQGGTFDDNDYARLTGASVDDGGGDDGGGDDSGGGGDDGGGGGGGTTPTPTPSPEPPGTKPPIVIPPGVNTGDQTQIVNQDNDINTNVTGDGNTVTNNQDNSVNQFGSYGTAGRAKALRDKYVADVSRFVRA